MDIWIEVAERLHFEMRGKIVARVRRCRGSSERSPSSAPIPECVRDRDEVDAVAG